jgi:hypothetical protein
VFHADAKSFARVYFGRVKTAILFLTLLQSSTETWVNAPKPLQVSSLNQFVNVTNAAVYKSGAAQLIRETIGIEPRDLTFLIHVVRWSDGGEIVKQNWYVFHSGRWSDGQFSSAKRIYGRGQVWFLYIQLNARSSANTTYTIETAKHAPAYFDHLQSAAGMFGISLTGAGEARNIWNAKLLTIPYVPSNVVITPTFGGAEAATFDDEGLSWFDFSAAVPVTKTGSTGMFGVVDLYFRPTDIKGLGFGSWPHVVEGVWVGSQPLKHILLGVGWGPMYGGVVMGNGSYSFSFGVNISAGAALKK